MRWSGVFLTIGRCICTPGTSHKTLIERTGSASVYRINFQGKEAILKEFHDEVRRRKEIKTCKKIEELKIKNVPRFYDLTNNIIMEYIDGRNIKDFHDDMKRENRDEYLSEMKRAITGMFNRILEIHSHGLVHFDLHRLNVFITPENIILIDFGESKFGMNFYFDFHKLKMHILDKINDEAAYGYTWKDFIDWSRISDPEALMLMVNDLYDFNGWLFCKFLNPNACHLNFLIINTLATPASWIQNNSPININKKYMRLICQRVPDDVSSARLTL